MYALVKFGQMRRAAGSASFNDDADVNNWVAAVIVNGGTVSNGRKQLVYNLITGLKSDGIWSKFDRLWLFAAENAGSALTDLVAGALATNSGATFTIDRGYAGNGSTTYVNSNFNPGAGGVSYTQNDASMGVWTVTSRAADNGRWGRGDALFVVRASFTTGLFAVLNRGGLEGFAEASIDESSGFSAASRLSSSGFAIYRNGTSPSGVQSNVSQAIGSDTFFIAGGANIGGLSTPIADQIACAVFGGGLTATEESNLYPRLRTYMTAVGVP